MELIYITVFVFIVNKPGTCVNIRENIGIHNKASQTYSSLQCTTPGKYVEPINPRFDDELNRTYSDVQMQYIKLPYPPVDETQLSAEKLAYESKRTTPYLQSFQQQLEYINHYLFQGKQTFA